jgi:hypothetical protein
VATRGARGRPRAPCMRSRGGRGDAPASVPDRRPGWARGDPCPHRPLYLEACLESSRASPGFPGTGSECLEPAAHPRRPEWVARRATVFLLQGRDRRALNRKTVSRRASRSRWRQPSGDTCLRHQGVARAPSCRPVTGLPERLEGSLGLPHRVGDVGVERAGFAPGSAVPEAPPEGTAASTAAGVPPGVVPGNGPGPPWRSEWQPAPARARCPVGSGLARSAPAWWRPVPARGPVGSGRSRPAAPRAPAPWWAAAPRRWRRTAPSRPVALRFPPYAARATAGRAEVCRSPSVAEFGLRADAEMTEVRNSSPSGKPGPAGSFG